MNHSFVQIPHVYQSVHGFIAQLDLSQLVSSNEGKEAVQTYLNAYGVNSGSGGSLAPAKLIAWFLFSSIGFVAFMYGKKQSSWRAMGIGVALMGYGYFFSSALALYGIGIALTAALYFWRE